ncbi:hypothetical protein FN846DRAFT_536970 [Sphaerosporella brunnea]|uniref:Armadillo-type protein n=1 Tax=Sphaerosporella brunnea TaxID=1250544 RepID=A0A5J5EF86_9PEZI|nr:hypothetical protein FN846DRAFT_536970 [Sphaerosporella brunnea]
MSLSSEKLTWLLAGVGTIVAIYSTYWQLANYKQQAMVKPSGTRSVGVEQSTEDAIKHSTLSILARGVNPELRSAALKILCERALKDDALSAILDKAESSDLSQNFVALRVLGLLQNASPRRLVQLRVFEALLGVLRRSSSAGGLETTRCQREALSLLSRLISLGDPAQQYAIDAGLLDWIKDSRAASYNSLLAEVVGMNRNEPIDQSLYDLLSTLCGRGTIGRDSLLELGVLRNIRGTSSSSRPFELEHNEWVEVEVDAHQGASGQGNERQAEEAQPEESVTDVRRDSDITIEPGDVLFVTIT